jgi:hypothetical protein
MGQDDSGVRNEVRSLAYVTHERYEFRAAGSQETTREHTIQFNNPSQRLEFLEGDDFVSRQTWTPNFRGPLELINIHGRLS